MNTLLETLRGHARSRPNAIALRGSDGEFTYLRVVTLVEALAAKLANSVAPLGVLVANSPAWALIDLAAARAHRPLLPLPQFFSDAQLRHALSRAGADEVLSDDPARIQRIMRGRLQDPCGESLLVGDRDCRRLRLRTRAPVALPRDTAKITFTSGTTGEPKGVCLSGAHIEQVAGSLAAVVGANPSDHHLAMLPLATLLENIGGVYLPLLAGACSELRPMTELGLGGPDRLAPHRLLGLLARVRPTTLILVPQLLEILVRAAEAGASLPESLRFVAVGGASVAPRLLQRAAAHGLPVHEGYGLSECASVLALNPLGEARPGSVGRPLPHVHLDFAADGEILVHGSPFLGYLKAPHTPGGVYATGDTGYLDDDGYLHLTGRKKSMFVTSFGRNVAPEWVERELTAHPAIAQAAVFGEAQPTNIAVLSTPPGVAPDAVAQAVATANAQLPDYARVGAWLMADAPFSPANQQLTANGRARRTEILAAYGPRIDALYQQYGSSQEQQG